MKSLDIYLSGLSSEAFQNIKAFVEYPNFKSMPLMSWDFFMESYNLRLNRAKKYSELQQIITFSKIYNWKNNLIKTWSENDYEALILTDKSQQIIWVNDGFTTMTGYSKAQALNQTPRFLQGPQTSIKTKEIIKKNITLNKPFTTTITNHRKDGSTYQCEVKIFPLYNTDTTHYIAFEKKVI